MEQLVRTEEETFYVCDLDMIVQVQRITPRTQGMDDWKRTPAVGDHEFNSEN